MTIGGLDQEEFGKSDPWSEHLREHLDTFRQGHVFEGLPVVFVGSSAQRLWQRPTIGLHHFDDSTDLVVLEDNATLRHGIVLTQACDLMKPTWPWVSVSPVYEGSGYLDAHRLASARGGTTWHLFPLDPPWATAGETWFADLRIEVPIEKAVLLGRSPLEAFPDDCGYARFAERLGIIRRRAALAEVCHEHVAEPLFTWVRSRPEPLAQRISDTLLEVRLIPDHHSAPRSVTVLIVVHSAPEHDVVEAWEDAFESLHPIAHHGGLTLLDLRVATLEQLSAADYLASVPIVDESSS